MARTYTVGIIPDVHIPFHDEAAYALALTVLRELDPKELVLIGDYGDFYSVTSHPKGPEIRTNFLDEVKAVNEHLDELDDMFPSAMKMYLSGNHEDRMARYIAKNAPELYGFPNMKWHQVLRLEQRRRWQWQDYTKDQLYRIGNTDLYTRHKPFATGRGHGIGTAEKGGLCLAYGHLHKVSGMNINHLDGTQIFSYCVGWLGDNKSPATAYLANPDQWALNVASVVVDPNTWDFFFQNHRIIRSGKKLRCLVNGTIYEVKA